LKNKNEKEIYTVSEINSLIKGILADVLPEKLVIKGEISNWKHHSSGHCYFSLKDENAVLNCVMWSSDFRLVKFKPADGIAVFASGFIDVYEPQGKYQLYVEKLEPAGVGALQLAFEQMVKRLAAEGLFDEKHKKALPPYPQRIGILTSESGAAIGDIVHSITTRWPCVRLFLYPVPVQGEGAAEEIAEAIRDVNKRNKELKLDLLIVGRGGGSLEDLWAFNEEVLARAIYNSKIPIISAVGHEYDTTIADLVADKHAATPTKAGVVAVPDAKEVMEQLNYFENRIVSETKWKIQSYSEELRNILASSVFKRPKLLIQNAQQRVDELGLKMGQYLKVMLLVARKRLHEVYDKVIRIEPHRFLGKLSVELNNMRNRTNIAMQAVLNKRQMQITAQENRLAGLNPKSVLQRGYSITTNAKTGLLIKKREDVEVGDLIVTELAQENLIESKVIKK
jgi:exodeoxyribonuclease VII large subunit